VSVAALQCRACRSIASQACSLLARPVIRQAFSVLLTKGFLIILKHKETAPHFKVFQSVQFVFI
jgi:hypothetical protein